MNRLDRIIGWLRAGYPKGVPQGDYIALLGVLHRELTDTDIEKVALKLRATGESGIPEDVSEERIREMIRSRMLQEPTEADVRRVAAHLTAGGWPLAGLSAEDPQGAAERAPDGPVG